MDQKWGPYRWRRCNSKGKHSEKRSVSVNSGYPVKNEDSPIALADTKQGTKTPPGCRMFPKIENKESNSEVNYKQTLEIEGELLA
ncbi:hypothetical protein VNO78_22508 [Psophocarpus tetragonolobus]|uniref:Uncharacterized protein n=1 Tax=Psophocarpus tetragonolobus TaxID=3891 RepID=A0AAN9XBL6_PSOTE